MTQKTFTIRITTKDDAAMTDILDQLSAVMNAAMGQGATIELANDSDAKVTQARQSKPRSSAAERVTCENCGQHEHDKKYSVCYRCSQARRYGTRRRYA